MRHTLILALGLIALTHGQQWQGAKMVWQTDTSDLSYMDNAIWVCDAGGLPWILWKRMDPHNSGRIRLREMSHWDGRSWAEPQRLPDTIKPDGGYWDAALAADGRLWLIYPNRPLGNYSDIQSARYTPGTNQWDLPVQVNAPDTNSLDDFYPRIDIGGGQVWATWFNEVGSRAICDIKASRWDDSAQSWGPELTVNPDTSGINRMEWFPDIAVDEDGTPHVVWTCSTPSGPTTFLYSRYDSGHWTAPESVCNPESLSLSGPYGGTRPRLVDDANGNLHCVVLGSRPNDSVVGLFYFRRTDGQWSKPVRTDTWSTTGAPMWDKDLAVASPDDIWVAFDRGGGHDWMVFAQHYDGHVWTPEDRIDDGRTFRGGFPTITIDSGGCPFVAWSADSSRTGYKPQVWYNRYAAVGLGEGQPVPYCSAPAATLVRSVLVLRGAAGGKRPAVGASLLDVSGRNVLELRLGANDVRALAPGVYFVRELVAGSGEQYRMRKVVIAR
jgi:hypothetical protein